MTPVERLRAAEVLLREGVDWVGITIGRPVVGQRQVGVLIHPNVALALAEVLKDAAEEWGDYRGLGSPVAIDALDALADALLGVAG